MIGNSTELVAWIHDNLPALDETRFEQWQAETATAAALSAEIHVRIHTPGIPDRTTHITLTAAPIADTDADCPPRIPSPAPDPT
ncbi:hypothetical protein [Nocardia sp. NPDC050710]|uniref:hypothetical protein n=1 Tax=Nocardia sp. NPDC050710 TaxID=3157220 RepID=UPI00340AEBBD